MYSEKYGISFEKKGNYFKISTISEICPIQNINKGDYIYNINGEEIHINTTYGHWTQLINNDPLQLDYSSYISNLNNSHSQSVIF